MNLCLFQGTFNPIHKAHLRVAKYVLENCVVDKLLFIPAYNPPHKDALLILPEHRLNMVKLAVEDLEKAEVSDIEYQRKGTSYTYLTIRQLLEQYKPDEKIKFIIGTDAFRHIESWYETKKLKDYVEFLLFIRDENFDINEFNHLRRKGYSYTLMDLTFENISSTEIRDAINAKRPLNDLVTKNVEEYINKHELYRNQL